MKLYLDCCCYNRPYDDQTQEKIHMEGEAILGIIYRCRQNHDEIVGSPVVDLEIDNINNIEKREKVRYFYEKTITMKLKYSIKILERVKELSEQTNIKTIDKFHLSFAENCGADVLLTTDKKFEKACSKLYLGTKVINPLNYLMEVIENGYDN